MRFVIWAWRSEKEARKRPAQDFQIKSKRAVALGPAFQATLHQFGERPMILIGYSLGAQVIAAALTSPTNCQDACHTFVAIAPVLDCDFSDRFQVPLSASHQVGQAFIFVNEGDRAIRGAQMVCRLQKGRCFESFEEWANHCSECLPGKVNTIDVTNITSRHHSIIKYTALEPIRSTIVRCSRMPTVDTGITPR
jgi:hypothetical protein